MRSLVSIALILLSQTAFNEHPYSGVSSPASKNAREFLGLPSSRMEFPAVMPDPCVGGGCGETPSVYFGLNGEGGAMKTRFFAPQAGVVSFDWNKIGGDWDTAYLSLWSDEPSISTRVNDWIYNGATFTGSFSPSGVDLCSRYYTVAPSPDCYGFDQFFNAETGWSTKTINIAQAGWYWLGFGLGEVIEGTVPSVLALDNLRFHVSEPSPIALVGIAFAGMAITRRRRQQISR